MFTTEKSPTYSFDRREQNFLVPMLGKNSNAIAKQTKKRRRRKMLDAVRKTFPYERCLRFSMVLACLIACTYQVVLFYKMYLNFDTTVSISVKTPRFSELPAITVCKPNGIFRRLVQKNYPEFYKNLTQIRSTKMRKLFPNFYSKLSMDEIKTLVGDASDMVTQCEGSDGTNGYSSITRTFCGNPVWFAMPTYKGLSSCYSYNAHWFDTPKLPNVYEDYFRINLKLNLSNELNIHPEDMSIVELYIHHQLEIPSIRLEKTNILRNYISRISVGKTTITYMPPPYNTRCTNYTEKRILEGKGPLCQKNCIQECLWNYYLRTCTCLTTAFHLFNHTKKCITTLKDPQCNRVNATKMDECEDACPVDCKVHLFDIGVSQGRAEDFKKSELEKQNNRDLGEVYIYSRSATKFLYKYEPKITPEEIFGYIGGCLSLWLGLSIPLLYNYLHQMAHGVMTRFQERQQQKSVSFLTNHRYYASVLHK